MSSIYQGLLFLINTLFDLALFVLAVRLILAWSGARYYDPITQFVVKLTDFVVKPIRRFLPNFKGIETSTLALIFFLECLKFIIIGTLSMGFPNLFGIAVLSIADAARLFTQTFFYAILIQALMSWVQPTSPLNSVLYQVTVPVLRPFQRLFPLVAGMDISPIPAMIFLQLLLIVLVNPLMNLGLSLSYAAA